jgi:hypothetical protein
MLITSSFSDDDEDDEEGMNERAATLQSSLCPQTLVKYMQPMKYQAAIFSISLRTNINAALAAEQCQLLDKPKQQLL